MFTLFDIDTIFMSFPFDTSLPLTTNVDVAIFILCDDYLL